MLAEAMSDPKMKPAVVFIFDGTGMMSFGQFGVTRQEMAYASVIAAQHAAEGEWE